MISVEAAAIWIESPGHRENLLEPSYTLAGVGSAMSGDRLYITMLYAAPVSDQGEAQLRREVGEAPSDVSGFAVALEQALTDAINVERGRVGLAGQSVDPILASVARSHAQSMLTGGVLSGSDLSGVSVLERALQADPGRTGRLAAGFWRGSGGLIWQAVVGEIVSSWSGGSNWGDALDPSFTAAGVGVATDGERVLVTVLFGEMDGV